MNAPVYASMGKRLLAAVIDSLIMIIPMSMANRAVPGVGGFALSFLYSPIFESSIAQATPGKFLMGLQVTDLNGNRLTVKTAVFRMLLRMVSCVFLFLGCLVGFFTERRQMFHDLIVGTQVVEGKFSGAILDAWVAQLRALFNSDQPRV